MNKILQSSGFLKGVAIALLAIVMYLLRDMLNLVLLAFIFTYLFSTFHSFLLKRMKIHPTLLLFIIYGAFLSVLSIVGYKFAPSIMKQVGDILNQLSTFKLDDYTSHLHPKVVGAIKDLDIGKYIRESSAHLLASIADISTFMLNIGMALMISFVFVLEKEHIKEFLKKFENSKVRVFYTIYKEFGKNFLNTFGKVIQIQLIVALANALLSMIGLLIIGIPHVLGLGCMIFFLGLIPVAGTFISLIPLAVIAFQVGGWIKIVHVLIMIVIIHGVENYLLNPKLYSVTLKLPIFFTFTILIVSEHLLGIWGLLIGIPIFMFGMNLINPKETSGEKSA